MELCFWCKNDYKRIHYLLHGDIEHLPLESYSNEVGINSTQSIDSPSSSQILSLSMQIMVYNKLERQFDAFEKGHRCPPSKVLTLNKLLTLSELYYYPNGASLMQRIEVSKKIEVIASDLITLNLMHDTRKLPGLKVQINDIEEWTILLSKIKVLDEAKHLDKRHDLRLLRLNSLLKRDTVWINSEIKSLKNSMVRLNEQAKNECYLILSQRFEILRLALLLCHTKLSLKALKCFVDVSIENTEYQILCGKKSCACLSRCSDFTTYRHDLTKETFSKQDMEAMVVTFMTKSEQSKDDKEVMSLWGKQKEGNFSWIIGKLGITSDTIVSMIMFHVSMLNGDISGPLRRPIYRSIDYCLLERLWDTIVRVENGGKLEEIYQFINDTECLEYYPSRSVLQQCYERSRNATSIKLCSKLFNMSTKGDIDGGINARLSPNVWPRIMRDGKGLVRAEYLKMFCNSVDKFYHYVSPEWYKANVALFDDIGPCKEWENANSVAFYHLVMLRIYLRHTLTHPSCTLDNKELALRRQSYENSTKFSSHTASLQVQTKKNDASKKKDKIAMTRPVNKSQHQIFDLPSRNEAKISLSRQIGDFSNNLKVDTTMNTIYEGPDFIGITVVRPEIPVVPASIDKWTLSYEAEIKTAGRAYEKRNEMRANRAKANSEKRKNDPNTIYRNVLSKNTINCSQTIWTMKSWMECADGENHLEPELQKLLPRFELNSEELNITSGNMNDLSLVEDIYQIQKSLIDKNITTIFETEEMLRLVPFQFTKDHAMTCIQEELIIKGGRSDCSSQKRKKLRK